VKQSTFLRLALQALLVAGWTLPKRWTVDDILKHDVDAFDVHLRRGEERAWLFIVWQGPDDKYEPGEEIISDHSINLCDVLDPLFNTK
jgi:hypothetical protein